MAGILLFGAIAWPFVISLFWMERRLTAVEPREATKPFSIEPGDLVRLMSIEQIETLERIDDPLGAAPAVPFGHLNAGWQKFLQQLLPGDTIWSFSTTWISEFELHVQEDGYTILRDGRPIAHYLTRSKILPRPRRELQKACFEE